MKFKINTVIALLFVIILGGRAQPATPKIPSKALHLCHNHTQRIQLYIAAADNNNDLNFKFDYIDSAIVLSQQLLIKPRTNKQVINKLLATALNKKGFFNKLNGNNLEGLKDINAALTIANTLNDLELVSNIQYNQGVVYHSMGAQLKAIHYFNLCQQNATKALATQPHNKSVRLLIMRANFTIGQCYSYLANIDTALQYMLPSLAYFKTLHDSTLISKAAKLIGESYFVNKQLKQAEYYLQESEKNTPVNTSPAELFNLKIDFADLYEFNHCYAQALSYIQQANVILRNSNNLPITKYILLHEAYANAYAGLRNYKKSIYYYRLLCNQLDSLYSVHNANYILEYQTKYETVAKQNQILQLTKAAEIKQLKLQQANADKQRLTWFAISAVAIITLLLALGYYLRRALKAQRALTQDIKNKTTTLTQQASTISRYQSQMNPHFVFNAINSIQGLLTNNETQLANTQLDYFSVLMRTTLHNSEHEYITLANEITYLTQYATFEQNNASFNFKFEVVIDDAIDATNTLLPPMLLQPFVENCIKHGGFNEISNATITLHISVLMPHIIAVHCIDNGKGITGNTIIKGQSRAIGIAQERIRLCFLTNNTVCDNYFQLTNTTPQGLTVQLKLPYIQNY